MNIEQEASILAAHSPETRQEDFFKVLSETERWLQAVDQTKEHLPDEVIADKIHELIDRLPKESSWAEKMFLTRLAILPRASEWVRNRQMGKEPFVKWRQQTLRVMHDATYHHPDFRQHLGQFWRISKEHFQRNNLMDDYNMLRAGFVGENAVAHAIRSVGLVPYLPKPTNDMVKKVDLYAPLDPSGKGVVAFQIKRNIEYNVTHLENFSTYKFNKQDEETLDQIFSRIYQEGNYDLAKLSSNDRRLLANINEDAIFAYTALRIDKTIPVKVSLPGGRQSQTLFNEDGVLEPEFVAEFKHDLQLQNVMEVK